LIWFFHFRCRYLESFLFVHDWFLPLFIDFFNRALSCFELCPALWTKEHSRWILRFQILFVHFKTRKVHHVFPWITFWHVPLISLLGSFKTNRANEFFHTLTHLELGQRSPNRSIQLRSDALSKISHVTSVTTKSWTIRSLDLRSNILISLAMLVFKLTLQLSYQFWRRILNILRNNSLFFFHFYDNRKMVNVKRATRISSSDGMLHCIFVTYLSHSHNIFSLKDACLFLIVIWCISFEENHFSNLYIVPYQHYFDFTLSWCISLVFPFNLACYFFDFTIN
jgi:hypothetical protein